MAIVLRGPEATVVRFDDGTADGESYPHSRVFCGVKGFEKQFGILSREADVNFYLAIRSGNSDHTPPVKPAHKMRPSRGFTPLGPNAHACVPD